MAKKKYSRKFSEKMITVRDLIRELKSEFHPDDSILIFTASFVPVDSKIDVENNRSDFTLHNISNKLSDIDYLRQLTNRSKQLLTNN